MLFAKEAGLVCFSQSKRRRGGKRRVFRARGLFKADEEDEKGRRGQS
jgi:hypothetical protein